MAIPGASATQPAARQGPRCVWVSAFELQKLRSRGFNMRACRLQEGCRRKPVSIESVNRSSRNLAHLTAKRMKEGLRRRSIDKFAMYRSKASLIEYLWKDVPADF